MTALRAVHPGLALQVSLALRADQQQLARITAWAATDRLPFSFLRVPVFGLVPHDLTPQTVLEPLLQFGVGDLDRVGVHRSIVT